MRSTPVGVVVVVLIMFAISTAGVAAVRNVTVTILIVLIAASTARAHAQLRSFKTNQTVSIDTNVKPGTEIHVAGALTQPCDERIVYPNRTMAVRWTIRVEQPV